MKFWDREKEKEWLKRYLKSEPNAILFVYGPKSSGKSTLLMKAIDEIKEKLYTYYYDLRLVPVSGYKDVLRIFFRERGWREKLKKAIPEIASAALKYFEVDGEVLEEMFEMKLNPFEVMENAIKGRKMRSKREPVIVFDELQKLKEVYMNGGRQRPLVKELFNFFVRLTKVTHLSHVIVMSSDTFFIEEVYSDSTLKNTSEFYLVDFFDDDTAIKILIEEGLDENVAKEVISKIGGVPWMMERILSSDEPTKKVEDLYKQSKARILGFFDEKKIRGEDIGITKEVFKKVLENQSLDAREELIELRRLFKEEILFYDPINRTIRFQTRLDKLAAEDLLMKSTI